nr:LytTR family DNA-binding domain-containing protein [Maritimibacter dapengensis]
MTRGSTRASTRILDRLPIEKRGPLISLSVQDHYVEVATTKGTELVLLRLSDAMAEVGDTPGLQVHRSHWIATGAVKSARRDGARAILTMADGRDIPVSRTYLPAIKEAGLLPR